MLLPTQRLLFLAITNIVAVLMAMNGKTLFLIVASFISLLILWDYIQRSTVPIAMRHIYKSQYTNAEKAIQYVNNANRLNTTNKAKYHLAKGLIAHYKEEYDVANEQLQTALSTPLKNGTDQAMAILALSDIAIIKKQKSLAKTFFNQLKDLKVNKSLMPSIQQMQEYLAKY